MTALATRPRGVDVSRGAFHVWQRHRDVALQLWRSETLGIAVEPWAVILALGLGLGRFVELDSGQDYVQFLAPGLLAVFPMFAAVFECAWGSYVRLEMQHTFHAIIATPVSVDDVITGEILWGTTRATVNASYILLVEIALSPWLGMVHSPWALLAIPLSALVGLLFSSIALTFVSVARALSQFSYFFNLLIIPMFWFSGCVLPLRRSARLGADPRLVHSRSRTPWSSIVRSSTATSRSRCLATSPGCSWRPRSRTGSRSPRCAAA